MYRYLPGGAGNLPLVTFFAMCRLGQSTATAIQAISECFQFLMPMQWRRLLLVVLAAGKGNAVKASCLSEI
jgi:hypothetical protein